MSNTNSNSGCKLVSHSVILKIRGNDKSYQEGLEASAKFNKRLCNERRMRIPFIDSQTKVAQTNSLTWYQDYQRSKGTKSSQIYTYPVKKWYKNRRLLFENDCGIIFHRIATPIEPHHLNENSNSMDALSYQPHGVTKQSSSSIDDYSSITNGTSTANQMSNLVSEEWNMHEDSFENFENNNNNNNNNNENENESENDEYEESKRKKHKKARSNKKKVEVSHDDKPFVCDRCGVKYKTKPGLTYHIQKTHSSNAANAKPSEVINADENTNSVFDSVYEDMNSSSSVPHTNPHLITSNSNSSMTNNQNSHHHASQAHSNQTASNNQKILKCEVCFGMENEIKVCNSENIVTCFECGRSYHHVCLNFTANMIFSVKKYKWQCIECKKCTICGNSENDDKLLFCDDCDRGYHMYCIKPPLTEAPPGDWRCELCVKQFGSQ